MATCAEQLRVCALLAGLVGGDNVPKINTPLSGHAAPAAVAGWQWLPYSNAAFLTTLTAAMTIIHNRIRGHVPCNNAFRALPGGRSFSDVWNDPNIWLSCDPGRTGGRFGATLGNEVTISGYSLAMGHWTTCATLIHELAHVNGAPGGTAQAEDTLLSCLLRGHHDPTIIGQILHPLPGTRIDYPRSRVA